MSNIEFTQSGSPWAPPLPSATVYTLVPAPVAAEQDSEKAGTKYDLATDTEAETTTEQGQEQADPKFEEATVLEAGALACYDCGFFVKNEGLSLNGAGYCTKLGQGRNRQVFDGPVGYSLSPDLGRTDNARGRSFRLYIDPSVHDQSPPNCPDRRDPSVGGATVTPTAVYIAKVVSFEQDYPKP